jgi:hypothetical protein
MTETITSAMVAAVLLSPGWLPVRETETRHGGAVVIRTVARPENGPDLKAVDRQTIQVSRAFLERLDAEIQADKQAINRLTKALENLANTFNQGGWTAPKFMQVQRSTAIKEAREAIAKPAKQIP